MFHRAMPSVQALSSHTQYGTIYVDCKLGGILENIIVDPFSNTFQIFALHNATIWILQGVFVTGAFLKLG